MNLFSGLNSPEITEICISIKNSKIIKDLEILLFNFTNKLLFFQTFGTFSYHEDKSEAIHLKYSTTLFFS